MGDRPPATALVEQKHVVALRIEETAMRRGDSTTGAAMQENRRLRARSAASFEVKLMTVTHVEHAALIRIDGGI